MKGWMDCWMNGLTDGWMDRLTDRLGERGREGGRKFVYRHESSSPAFENAGPLLMGKEVDGRSGLLHPIWV